MNTPSYFHFSLADNMHAAYFEGAIIILDAQEDNYISLIDDAADYFCLILKQQFMQNSDNQYYFSDTLDNTDTYNYWITYFIEKKFIIRSNQLTNNPTFLKEPLKSGGLIQYHWDSKTPSLWNPFSESSILDIMRAYYLLFKIDRSIKRSGISAIIALLKKKNFKKNSYTPSEQEIKKLSAAIDAASILYPKKIYCLAWAATFTILALKKGWRCNLVIGVQINPFYAHAWAECENRVIHDNPVIAEVLSIIFKEPYR